MPSPSNNSEKSLLDQLNSWIKHNLFESYRERRITLLIHVCGVTLICSIIYVFTQSAAVGFTVWPSRIAGMATLTPSSSPVYVYVQDAISQSNIISPTILRISGPHVLSASAPFTAVISEVMVIDASSNSLQILSPTDAYNLIETISVLPDQSRKLWQKRIQSFQQVEAEIETFNFMQISSNLNELHINKDNASKNWQWHIVPKQLGNQKVKITFYKKSDLQYPFDRKITIASVTFEVFVTAN